MSAGSFRFAPYDWPGGREWMLVRDGSIGPHVLLFGPLLEEMNFTRTLLAGIGRELARRGVTSWLPDLPGAGESLVPPATVRWQDWRNAARAAGAAVARHSGRPPLTCALRGGALLDDAVEAVARWRYAPATGETLLRQMRRAQLVSDRHAAGARPEAEEPAGYALSRAMLDGLGDATPAPIADRELAAGDGIAPWRRAEPGRDDVLAQRLAEDIYDWTIACAGGR